MSHLIAPGGAWAPASSCVLKQRYAMAVTPLRVWGYLPSEARTADGALPLSKRVSEHGPNPPPQPTSSVGG